MAHFAKYGKAATGHLSKHFERAKQFNEKTGQLEYVKFGNEDIDPARTHLNYNLAPERPEGQIGFIKKRMSEIKCQNRKDINVMCSCVVTLPKVLDEEKSEWVEQPDGSYELKEVYKEFRDDEEREFFKTTYNELCAKFGAENVISAYVHKDETQPHIHFAFVPAVPDRSWNKKHPEQSRQKLCAKECVSRAMLCEFHKDLQTTLDEKFGVGYFPVLNGATERGNLSVAEMKAQRAVAEITENIAFLEANKFNTQLDLSSLQHKFDTLKSTVGYYEKNLSDFRSEIQELEHQRDALSAQLTANNDKLSKLQHQISVLNNDIKNRENILAELLKQVKTAENQLQDIKIAAQDEIALAKKTIADMVNEAKQEHKYLDWNDWNKKLDAARPGFRAGLQEQRDERDFKAFLKHNPGIKMQFEQFQRTQNQQQKDKNQSHGNR